ncbi:MAG TPA: CAAX prenyl protease-related protein [Methylibium sp.]|nr:CAAX prenyl protease-related protein [Methylibium sp.]
MQGLSDPARRHRLFPFLAFMLVLVVRSLLPEQTEGGIDLRWLYALQVGLAAALLALWWREFTELAAQPGVRDAALSVAVGVGVWWLWIRLDEPWMRFGAPDNAFNPVGPGGEVLWALIAVRWLGATLVVPLMEELFWRSLLMRWIEDHDFMKVDPKRVGARAIVLSTFVFTLAHTEWLAAALAGLAYALLYRYTGKLWTAVLAHAVTNGVLGLWVIVWGHWGYW